MMGTRFGKMPSASVSPKCAALSRTSGNALDRHFEQLAELRVPLELADVEQQRAAGVGEIRGEHLSAGKPVNQIGVNRADDGVAALEFGGDGGFVLDQPAEL